MDGFTFVAYASVQAVEPFIVDSNLTDNMRSSVSAINIFLVTIATYLSPLSLMWVWNLSVRELVDLLCRDDNTYTHSYVKKMQGWGCAHFYIIPILLLTCLYFLVCKVRLISRSLFTSHMVHTVLQPPRVLTRATGTQGGDFPVWIPIVAAIGALLLLAIIVIILYFVSFSTIFFSFGNLNYLMLIMIYKLQYQFSHFNTRSWVLTVSSMILHILSWFSKCLAASVLFSNQWRTVILC